MMVTTESEHVADRPGPGRRRARVRHQAVHRVTRWSEKLDLLGLGSRRRWLPSSVSGRRRLRRRAHAGDRRRWPPTRTSRSSAPRPTAGSRWTRSTQLKPDIVTHRHRDAGDGRPRGRRGDLRKTHARLPVIMFSTLTERGAAATLDALAAGATDYVTKPTNVGSVGRVDGERPRAAGPQDQGAAPARAGRPLAAARAAARTARAAPRPPRAAPARRTTPAVLVDRRLHRRPRRAGHACSPRCPATSRCRS